MSDAIQLVTLATFAAALFYLVTLVIGQWRTKSIIAESHSMSRGIVQAEINEILERTRVKKSKSEDAWSGLRKFKVARKQMEATDVCSFYLEPHDGKELPSFQPGQFLNFKIQPENRAKPAFPCYSLSDSPKSDYYRVTVKHQKTPPKVPDAPPGVSSSYFHEELEEGSIIDVKSPKGGFYLDTTRQTPVVLIGGGIGITPGLSMLNHIVETGSRRETWFFLGIKDGDEHMFKEHLEEVAAKYENVRLVVCYSRPREGVDVEGRDYHVKGRVGADLFKEMLPSNNYDYYFCGPPPMMDSLFEGLTAWEVPEDNIHYEAFGPATVGKKKEADAAASVSDKPAADVPTFDITFKKSNKTVPWDPNAHSLLRFAMDNDVAIDYSCEAGNCGTCLTALVSGDVDYISDPAEEPEKGTCYACVSVPKGAVSIDA
ncbi:MAG: 2Fe-2S iron-sulfur cluster binding domain-containing protein [Rhodospirillaceae bacterium]|nr:2Fe-2S iron-sulfur cluster binding domain-containing protein [Rhodospirillaceae bacterium]